jgi:hypothetical protein
MVYWYEMTLEGSISYSTKPIKGLNWPQGIQEYDFDMKVEKGK